MTGCFNTMLISCILLTEFCSLDPPEISIEGTSTPAVEYTTRNINCATKAGNPLDQKIYNYEWIYMPTYGASTTYVPVSSGKS